MSGTSCLSQHRCSSPELLTLTCLSCMISFCLSAEGLWTKASDRWVNVNTYTRYLHVSASPVTHNLHSLTMFSCHSRLTGLSYTTFHHSEHCCGMKIRVLGSERHTHRTTHYSTHLNKQSSSLSWIVILGFVPPSSTSGYCEYQRLRPLRLHWLKRHQHAHA